MPFSDWNQEGRSYLLDVDGNILDINSAALAMFHTTRDRIIGKNIFDFMPKKAVEKRRMLNAEILRTGQPLDMVDDFDGTPKHSRTIPLFDENGNVYETIVLVTDVKPQARRRDVLWERLTYAWGSAKPSAKFFTFVGLWFAGRVTDNLFFVRCFTVAFLFLAMAIATMDIHMISLLNGIIAGGTLITAFCGIILRYFIR